MKENWQQGKYKHQKVVNVNSSRDQAYVNRRFLWEKKERNKNEEIVAKALEGQWYTVPLSQCMR